jgi:hypothetical protein
MIMCIRPLDPRYVDPRLPLYSLHLSSTDSWVAHTLYALSEIAYRDFAISDVLSSFQYKNPIPEIPCSKRDQRSRLSLARRLRLHRDFSYREIGTPEVK